MIFSGKDNNVHIRLRDAICVENSSTADYTSVTSWDVVPLNSAVNKKMGLLLFASTRFHMLV